MDALIPVVGIGAFAFVAFVIYWVVSSERKRKAARAHEAFTHGFQRIAVPDPAILKRITDLHARGGVRILEVRNLHRKEIGGFTSYLFDLADNSGENTDLVCDRAIAIVSSSLQLPRFTLIPRIEQEGKVAALGNWLIRQSASRAGKEVAFPSVPGFHQRYLLMAEDEQAARRFFTADRLAQLAGTQYWLLVGGGDALTVDRLEIGPSRRSERSLLDRLHDAERAVGIFFRER